MLTTEGTEEVRVLTLSRKNTRDKGGAPGMTN